MRSSIAKDSLSGTKDCQFREERFRFGENFLKPGCE
jgi:hypothetical protein